CSGGTAIAWELLPDVILVHDGTDNSCRFVSTDGLWVLEVTSSTEATLTYNSTDAWELLDDGSTWNCLSTNIMVNPDPPEEHDEKFVCLTPYLPCSECSMQTLTSGESGICGDCESARHWSVCVAGQTVLVHWDRVEDSCTFESLDGNWVLDISAGTLTYDGTDVWELDYSDEWDCLGPNLLVNRQPPEAF